MTPDEARETIIDGLNYAAYHETDSSLHDSDKNRLFGNEYYRSDRPVYNPSPWAGADLEEKMATLLVWANMLNRSSREFGEAQTLLQAEELVVGRVIRQEREKMKSNDK
jgi:hypothetical protein